MTTPSEAAHYDMRGHRVPALGPTDIDFIAGRICKIFKLSHRSFSVQKIGMFINDLEENGIFIDSIENDEWMMEDIARAMVDPQKGFIYMPEWMYEKLNRSDPEAIRIFLHELGHIFLCHRAMLHFSDTKGILEEDSEWQADEFADAIIRKLKLKTPGAQLELKYF